MKHFEGFKVDTYMSSSDRHATISFSVCSTSKEGKKKIMDFDSKDIMKLCDAVGNAVKSLKKEDKHEW